jgi:hypothetical protein
MPPVPAVRRPIPFVLTAQGHAAVGTQPDAPRCPVCGGPTWNRSLTKRTPDGADFACRDRMCAGALGVARSSELPPAA